MCVSKASHPSGAQSVSCASVLSCATVRWNKAECGGTLNFASYAEKPVLVELQSGFLFLRKTRRKSQTRQRISAWRDCL